MARPTNWILATPDWSDAATITTNSAEAAAPVTNLQEMQPTDLWASQVGVTTPYLELDRGSAQPWNLVLLLFTNASNSGMFRVRSGPSQASVQGSSAPYDSGQALRTSDGNYAFQQSAAYASPVLFTLEIRFRLRFLPSSGFHLLCTRSNGTADLSISIDTQGRLVVDAGSLSLTSQGNVASLYRTYTASLVFTAGTASLYLDGVFDSSSSHSETIDGDTLQIGDTTAAAFSDVDWFRFWAVPRTADAIAADYNLQTPSSTANLLAHCRFNGSLANAGSVSGTWTQVGTPTYVLAERLWASPGLDNYQKKHGMLWVPGGVTQRWLRIDFEDLQNVDDQIKMGRLYVANAHQFDKNPSFGADTWLFEDGSQSVQLAGGQRVIESQQPVPGFRLPFQFTSEADMMSFYEIVRVRGASSDVGLVLNPIDSDGYRHRRIGYGTLQARFSNRQTAFNRFEGEVALSGLI